MLSICIITKNEAHNLEECLKKIANLGYEIVVVDTGSTDRSKEVALNFTPNVYDFTWCNDFSAARNFASEKASNDFILMLDTDEFVTSFQAKQVEALIKKNPDKVGRMHRNNKFVREGVGFSSNELVSRLYSKRLYHYTGKIHEQIEPLNGSSYGFYEIPVYTDHSGYDDTLENRKKKAKRNIDLLEASLKEDGEDPYLLYQLGKAYYYNQDYVTAVAYFERVTTYDLNPKLEYVIDMITMYGYAMINAGQPQNALLLEGVYDEFSNTADFVFMMGTAYVENAMFDKAVNEFLLATKIKECKMQGVNSYLAYYNIGVILECLGKIEEARGYYKKCGSYEPAKKRLGMDSNRF